MKRGYMFSPIFMIPMIGAVLTGFLNGLLGYFVKRLNLGTISFTIAHAALAGVAISMITPFNQVFITALVTMVTAVTMALITHRYRDIADFLSMVLFNLFNAIAVLSLYMSMRYVLASYSLSALLWGHVLTLTISKLAVLVSILMVLLIYIILAKHDLNALLFDYKLAEAEGVDLLLHILVLLILIGVTMLSIIQFIGGFLAFSLLYNPVLTAGFLTKNAEKQQIISPVIGMSTSLLGFLLSLHFNTPIGASIALISTSCTLISFIARLIYDSAIKGKMKG
ncbi:MAG: metal ABC transporter permease [Desulfurococcaceae archaeon]